MFSDIYSTFTLHNIDIYSRHPPGNSESPSPCRWECLWRTGACCWGCPCLENKENVLEERHFCECECHPICRSSVCLDKGIIAFMTFEGDWNGNENNASDKQKYLPSCWSDVLQASMKVWATTERQLSTMLALPRSNTKFGFLMRLTQNLGNMHILVMMFKYTCVAGVIIPEGKRVWFPRMDDFWVCDTVLKSLVVQEVE